MHLLPSHPEAIQQNLQVHRVGGCSQLCGSPVSKQPSFFKYPSPESNGSRSLRSPESLTLCFIRLSPKISLTINLLTPYQCGGNFSASLPMQTSKSFPFHTLLAMPKIRTDQQPKQVRRSWLPLTPGSCLPNDKTFYSLAGVTIFYDCVIFLLPIPILMHLQINNRRKMALIAMFVLGLFTTVCSILRLIQIITIAKTGNSTMLVLWGTIEMNVGVSLFLSCP